MLETIKNTARERMWSPTVKIRKKDRTIYKCWESNHLIKQVFGWKPNRWFGFNQTRERSGSKTIKGRIPRSQIKKSNTSDILIIDFFGFLFGNAKQ